jgi:Fic family protein
MVRRAEEAEQRWAILEAETQAMHLPERIIAGLFNASMGFRLRNAVYREVAGVNENTAGRDLKALVAVGLLEAKGERRGRFYVATARLRALNESIRQVPRVIEDPFDLPVEPTLGL